MARIYRKGRRGLVSFKVKDVEGGECELVFLRPTTPECVQNMALAASIQGAINPLTATLNQDAYDGVLVAIAERIQDVLGLTDAEDGSALKWDELDEDEQMVFLSNIDMTSLFNLLSALAVNERLAPYEKKDCETTPSSSTSTACAAAPAALAVQ